MTKDLVTPILLIAGGVWLGLHCFLAGKRELQMGQAEGRYGSYSRSAQPLQYWTTIIATFVASAMGILSLCLGIFLALAFV